MVRSSKFMTFGLVTLVVVLAIDGIIMAERAYTGKVLPMIKVGGLEVGGMNLADARETVVSKVEEVQAQKVKMEIKGEEGRTVEATFAELGVVPMTDNAINKAATYGKSSFGFKKIKETVEGFFGVNIPIEYRINKEILDDFISQKLLPLVAAPKSANWVWKDGALVLSPAVEGKKVDTELLAKEILYQVKTGQRETIEVKIIYSAPPITDEIANQLKPDVEKAVAKPLILNYGEKTKEVPANTKRSWISLEMINKKPVATFSRDLVTKYLTETIAPEADILAQNARFEINEGKVTAFAAPVDGQELNVEKSVSAVRAAVEKGENTVSLVLNKRAASISNAEEADKFGIKALVGSGTTDFRGSPTNRVHNIKVGAEKFHGVLIPPGEEFAFNANLGPVTKENGYLPELVILHNVTKPEYGGGLCQVSTTMFRAAVLSGLKVTERDNHAYPVSYYGTPGFDATIYPNQRTWRDGTDLKFANDTPGYILIQTKVEGTKLTFDFWGTPDGREVKIIGPEVYDKKPDGSLKAVLTQEVIKDGVTLAKNVFRSSYKSPSLFPHVVAANAEPTPLPTPLPTPVPTPTPKPSAKPKPSPTPSEASW